MKRFAIITMTLFFLAAGAGLAGARINTTPSLPLGLYWVHDAKPTKGSVVLFCPPNQPVFIEAKARGYLAAGLCDAGTQPLMKRIVATEGDRVTIAADGTLVNGESLLNSAQVQADPEGRPLPTYRGEFTLVAGQILLISEHSPLSFDSRYFGPVDEQNLQGVVEPVWTFSR
jgi:conjugative transfer signal peptidase TraF